MTDPDSAGNSTASRGTSTLFSLSSVGLLLGPLAMIAWLAQEPGSLTPEAHRLCGVMLLTIIWWITEPIPIAATALAAVALAVFLGAVPGARPAETAFAPFADPSVFFLIGGMFLARAMSRHGLDRRLALSIVTARWAGRSPATVLLSVGLSVMLVSMWISNTASTAMVYPVTLGIIGVLGARAESGGAGFARSRYASALLLMTAYASSVGGIATPIGTATNVVAMGYFRRPEYFGQSPDFARWMMVGVPLMLLLGLGLFLWLKWHSSSAGLDLAALRGYLAEEHAQLGAWNWGELNTLIVFLTVVSLWVMPAVLVFTASPEARAFFTAHFPEEVVSILAPVLLFLLPVDRRTGRRTLEVEDFRKIDWGTILLFGGGLSLGNLMFKTGLAESLGRAAFDALGSRDVGAITALAIAGGILLSEFTSNAATASTLIPVIFAICNQAEIDPVLPLMGVTLGASFGSALPVSTPPNAIVYGSGLIPLGRMVAAGVGVDLIAGVTIWIVLRVAHGFGWNPLSG